MGIYSNVAGLRDLMFGSPVFSDLGFRVSGIRFGLGFRRPESLTSWAFARSTLQPPTRRTGLSIPALGFWVMCPFFWGRGVGAYCFGVASRVWLQLTTSKSKGYIPALIALWIGCSFRFVQATYSRGLKPFIK